MDYNRQKQLKKSAMTTRLSINHVNADVTLSVFYKERWQAQGNVRKVLQTDFFRRFYLLLIQYFKQLKQNVYAVFIKKVLNLYDIIVELNMNKEMILVVLMLLLPALALAAPAIHFQEPSYNFGTINQSDIAEHVFEFVNTGDQELVIEKVTSS